MEEITEIKEEVYKCSKCGLCMSVCPVFLATKNEMFLSRGRFIILNRFFNSSVKLTKKFKIDMDVCLNCNACKNFCPSSIDSYKIFTEFKQKRNFSFLYFLFLRIYRLLKFILKPFNPIEKTHKTSTDDNSKKVIFFQGCMNKYVDNSDKIATLNIIKKAGYSCLKVTHSCCGYPYLSDGNIKQFIKNAQKIMKELSFDSNYIVCSCDTCFDTLKSIERILPEFSSVSNKLIRIDEFLKLNNIQLKTKSDVVYHKPLLREDECYLPTNISRLNKKGSCSLMENFFMFKHPKIAKKILSTVFYKKEELEGKIIITSCMLSKQGLNINLKKIGSNSNVVSYSEYFDKNM